MAEPSLCTIVVGTASDFFGGATDIEVTVETIIDGGAVHIAWAETGKAYVTLEARFARDLLSGTPTFEVPHVNQPGFINGNGQPITFWAYRATVIARRGAKTRKWVKEFQAVVGQTSLHLAGIPDGAVTPGVTAPRATVTSVAGLTGSVEADELGAALGVPGLVAEALADDETVAAAAALAASEAVDEMVLSRNLRGRFPVLSIVTDGATPVTSKDDYVDGDFVITDTDRGIIHSGGLKIRGRGNSTWLAPKKPYRLNLDVATPLLGMRASQKNWALLANFYDASKINNAFALDLASRLTGLDWAPQFRSVEVTLNGDFLGIYQLTDLVRMEAGRLALSAANASAGDAMTGAYLLEIDARVYGENLPGTYFVTSHGVPLAYDTPSAPSAAQKSYIQGKVAAFEASLYSSDFRHPTAGYAAHIDTDSFIDWYLINELLYNTDSPFASSCFVYKNRDSIDAKLHMGPVWDFDLSFGRNLGYVPSPTQGFWTRNATWFARLCQDPGFLDAIVTRWELLRIALGGWEARIDQTIDQMTPAIERDSARWGSAVYSVAQAAERKIWLTRRIAWLDTALRARPSLYPATYANTY